MKKFLVYTSILILAISCSNPVEDNEAKVNDFPSTPSEKSEYDAKYADLEEDLTKFQMSQTIRYTKGSFSTQMEAYFDGEIPAIMKENYSIENGNFGTVNYVFKNGQLANVTDYHEISGDSTSPFFAEETIYVYKNDELVKTLYKKVTGEEELIDDITPTIGLLEPKRPHIQYLSDYLSQKNIFELCFKEISVQPNGEEFLRVGSKDENGYECYFRINSGSEDKLIKDLRSNPKDFVGKVLNIEFAFGEFYMEYLTGSLKE